MKGIVRWLLCCSWLWVMVAVGTAFAGNPGNSVYVIGDSLSDTGNLYDLTEFWPPSPPYAMRYSNGPVWAEYLAADLDVEVESLAYGGAFTGVYVVDGAVLSNFNNVQYPTLFTDVLPGVVEEIDDLLAAHPEGLNPRALYVVWAGPNDLFLGMVQPEAMPAILEAAVGNIAEAVCRIGTAGGRHFVVGNMPDLSLTPFVLDMDSEVQAQVAQAVTLFNAGLEQALAGLPDACAGTITLFDSRQAVDDIVAAPQDYGLTNVTESCLIGVTPCSNPDDYLFWDVLHPTTKAHAVIADKFRMAFCRTGEQTPGLRGRIDELPPPVWRGTCFGAP